MWEEGVDVGRMEDWRIVVFNWDSTDVNLIHGRINEAHSLVQ